MKKAPAASHADQVPETRIPLSRERVLRAAIGMADAGGIASISMRKLAQVLGVEAMSLYHHVANKDDILDGILDLVVGEIAPPSPDGAWKDALRRSAVSAHDVLERHPWACALMMSPARARPARLRYIDSVLGRLRQAGFSAAMTDHAYHALDSHILGSTLWEAGYAAGAEAAPDMASTIVGTLSVDEYPYLIEHIHQHQSPAGDDDIEEFEFGLDLILDGLERMLDQA